MSSQFGICRESKQESSTGQEADCRTSLSLESGKKWLNASPQIIRDIAKADLFHREGKNHAGHYHGFGVLVDGENQCPCLANMHYSYPVFLGVF